METKNAQEVLINKFLKIGAEAGYWDKGYGFPILCKQIFNNIDFKGKNVLEIGCGKGVFCIWASLHGAEQVIGLEPLEEGSYDSNKIFSNFEKITQSLNLNKITMVPEKIQEYDANQTLFDIVLSVASINHLDEESCIVVKKDRKAREIYKSIFKDISDKMNPGGKLIILDCSNENFFNSISIRNPFAKTIEWFKHQTPEFWSKLLEECGFINPKITWPTGRYLRYLNVFNRNKIFAYFIDSAFRLELTKS